jgi:hypothetical protein
MAHWNWSRLIGAAAPLVFWILVAGCAAYSCGPHPRHLDFSQLASADRIIVQGKGAVAVTTISEPQRIRDAVGFITPKQDGWTEALAGPRGAPSYLNFYHGEQFVGVFGISPTFVVMGSLHKDVDPAEIEALMKVLGLRWE